MLKHNDNLENKEKVKYDLYKILRMSILLNQKEVDKLTLDKFKIASLNIDKMLGESYDENLESMFYETTTLEEEEERLKKLVSFVSDRVEKRKNLLEDYRTVTKKELNGLEYINKSNELDLYTKRLKTIKEYLDTSSLIEVNTHDLEVIKDRLVNEYDLKSSNEIKNTKLEESLYNTFINALYEFELYSSINISTVEDEILKMEDEIRETKEQKDTFESAFNNLKISGISGELELEYASYVENAKRNYYYVKEKEIILKLYKLIYNKETEYSNLFKKREEVKSLLEERLNLRKTLNIKEKDLLSNVYELVLEQKQEIDSEKETVDNINILTERIKLKETRLEELNKIIKKPEILSILKEYHLIEAYDHDENIMEDYVDEQILPKEEKEESLDLLEDLLPEEFSIKEDTNPLDKEVVEVIKEEYLPNQIKESVIVPTMNFGLSRLKAISVMKRVGDMLGIKANETPEEKPVEIKEDKSIVDDLFIENDNKEPLFIKKPEPQLNDNNDDVFWTPNEFFDMKKEIEKNEENNSQEVNNDNSIFEFKMPEMKEEPKKVFENDNNLIFPEPVMPELNVLPENKEDKFVWPESTETFDINGIFPN